MLPVNILNVRNRKNSLEGNVFINGNVYCETTTAKLFLTLNILIKIFMKTPNIHKNKVLHKEQRIEL